MGATWQGSANGPRQQQQPITFNRADMAEGARRDDLHSYLTYADALPAVHIPQQRPHKRFDQTGYLAKQQATEQPDSVVVTQLGADHWLPGDRPDDAAGPVCAHCLKPLTPAKHSGGGTDNKKYCSASHRAAAANQRKKQAADQN
jgi:hypothetical protein